MKQENTYVRNVYTITPQQMLFLLKNIPPTPRLLIPLKPEATVRGSLRLLLAVNFMVPRAGLPCRRPHAEEHDGDGAGMVVGDIKTSRDRGRKKKNQEIGASATNSGLFHFPTWAQSITPVFPNSCEVQITDSN